MNFVRHALAATALLCAGATAALAQSSTLDAVKKRGELVCGTSQGVPGFSMPNAQGVWEGFDTDYCRAISAAIFDNPDKTKYLPLASKDRFTILQTGQIDVLIRTATWTMSRDASLGIMAAGVNFYDGQGFLVKKGAAKTSSASARGQVAPQRAGESRLSAREWRIAGRPWSTTR